MIYDVAALDLQQQKTFLLKHLFYIFLYLNIYSSLFNGIYAQNLHLKIETENTVANNVIDSLNLTLTFKDYRSLKKQADSLHILLQNIGYIENDFQFIKKENDSIFSASYILGAKYKKILVYYNKEDFSKKELLSISSEIKNDFFILPFSKIEASLQKLNQLKTINGNSFAKIHLENIFKNDDFTLSANLILQKGSNRKIDHIVIKGYEKFPESFLKYYAGLKKGAVFNNEKIRKQTEAINALGFTSVTKPPEALFKKNSTSVYLYLKKQKNNLFDGAIGFSNNKDTNKLIFNGYLNLELNNNLNYGEQFLLNYKADGDDQQNLRVAIKMPYLLKSPFGVALELKIFKKDSSFITTDQRASVNYQITPASNSYIGYKSYNSSNLLDETTESVIIEDFKSTFFIVGGSFIVLQGNILFPIKTSISLNAEIGKRNSNNSSIPQIKAIAVLQHIFNLNYKNSIFLKSNTHLFSSDTYLTNELFRFGGINSIRGFNENSIDASFYSVLNSEYRYQINQSIYTHSIIDIAYFENQTQSLKTKLYSFGIGIGLKTRAGILKFGIANGNAENQDFNFSNTKIHISISSQF